MTIPLEQLILLFTSLFAIFSPPANIGPFAAISGHFPRPIQRRIALQVAASYAGVLIISAWVGQWLLEILGVTVSGLTVAGGIALMLAGLPLMLRGDKPQPSPEEIEAASDREDWRSVVVVPLTFPMSVGGATAAIVIASASRYDSIPDLTAISLVCILMALVIFATHFFSGPVAKRLSPQNMDILTRVSGIVLVAIASQLLVKGTIELAVDAGLNRLLSNLGG
jgi:multiple antibiotic resistance protein